ncbi:MAG TPA: YitT family protein [Candidatus Scatomorpha stercoravium]|nr:YitT family protein [Candidatus Scatomorpha stercoravium]
MPKHSAKEIVRELAYIVGGAACYAVGYCFFFYPNSVVPGGVTGVSTIVNFLTGAPVGVLSIVLNIPLFAFAWRHFGLRFMLMSGAGMALTYIFIDGFNLLGFAATHDPLLACTIGAALNGTGLGLVYRSGATTGGTDIIAKVLRQKYPYINFGTFIMALNVVIISAYALIFRRLDAAFYAVIAMFVVSRAIDTVLYGLDTSKVCYLISNKSAELDEAITATMHRGVTKLRGEGGYTGEEREVLMCVIKKRQITDIRKLVKAIDPNAFFIVTDAKDVFGNGFGNINEE